MEEAEEKERKRRGKKLTVTRKVCLLAIHASARHVCLVGPLCCGARGHIFGSRQRGVGLGQLVQLSVSVIRRVG
jgi:hypothetical protein